MDEEKIQELFEDKYQKLLDISWDEWQAQAPQNETEAYAALQEIDDELKQSEDEYLEGTGDAKDELGEHREMLRNKYQFIEESFGLDSKDADW
jgi:hypothetical protein